MGSRQAGKAKKSVSHPIRFRPEADDEFHDACEWYESRDTGLGRRFSQVVEDKLRSIADSPELYPEMHRDIREANLGRFPYTIYFRVGENGVRVLSVFHNSRNPEVWQSRLDDE